MIITLMSDTHAMHGQLDVPAGDIFIFAGDMAHCRTARDVEDFNRFLGKLPHAHRIVVGGNHDHRLARDPEKAKALLSEGIYLQDELVVVAGVKIYGSPWQPLFNSRACDAFALQRGEALRKKWDLIPDDVDILVTHTPPAGILDLDGPVCHGCFDLTEALRRVTPRYHVFGHVHSNHGMVKCNGTSYINCSIQGPNGTLRAPLSLDYESGKVW
jgi:Icc-related predicted phosphoesterase